MKEKWKDRSLKAVFNDNGNRRSAGTPAEGGRKGKKMAAEKWIDIWAQTDRGRRRRKNEDYFGIYKPEDEKVLNEYGILTVVADGMGGTDRGGMASKVAVETISRTYYESKSIEVPSRLREAYLRANETVFREVARGVEHAAGTTCTAAVFLRGTLFVANAGDSRAYLFKDGDLEQLTQDHSLISRLVKQGKVSKEEAKTHPTRTVLTSSIGMTKRFTVDITGPVELSEHDRVLLSTDGLFNMIEDEEIGEILAGGTAKDACSQLVKSANKAGGIDNITVIVVDVLR